MNNKHEWENKYNALPRIPRAKSKYGYVDTLTTIFKSIEENESLDTIIMIDGSITRHSLKHYVTILQRYQFLIIDNNKVYIVESLRDYDKSDFREKVAKFLYLKIKYISEMLEYLNTPKSSKEILQNANDKFNMSWKEKGQIHERIAWLSDLGLINSMSYKQLYVISEEGKKFILRYKPRKPIIMSKYVYDQTLSESSVEIPKWISELEWRSDIKTRKISLGYVPGGRKNSISLILDVLKFCRNIEDVETIMNYINRIVEYKESSINGFLSFLTIIEVLDRIGEKVYRVSKYGEEVLNSDLPELWLVFLINRKYKYILEILLVLEESPHEPKELAALGVTEFNMGTENLDRIRERIIYLKNANLILNDKGKKLKLSNRGKLLCKIINKRIKLDKTDESIEKLEKNQESKSYITLLKETRLAATNSTKPHIFEKLLEKIFIELGFETELLAQSGTTDILLTAPTAPKYTYKVAIEAKTNREGKIKENAINFDALNEHKLKHKADFMVVVGKSFHGDRLKKFAENNGVLLMDIDNLETLVKQHQIYPLQAIEYKKLFNQIGIADISVLGNTYKKMHRQNELFKAIIETLIENSNDEFTEGILTMREIYLFIKSREIFKDSELSKEEVINMLNLLSNPLIGCVGVENKGYYAKGSLTDAQMKFGFYYSATFE